MNNEFDWTSRADGVAKFCAAITAVALFVWKIMKPLVIWFRNWKSAGSRIDKMCAIIERELKPNGIPIADKIADIKRHVQILTAREQLRFENSPIPTYECDAQGQCIAVNPAWCELFGVSEHGMLGNGWLDVIADPEERERVLANWTESVKSRYPHREKYTARNKRTGELIKCESATIECAAKDGKPLLYIGTVKQVTT